MKWVPHDYQRAAIKFIVERGAAGLLLDPGLGKTSITLAAFKILQAKGIVNKMLVIAPLRPAYQVWPAEARRWDEFAHLRVVVLHGPDKDRKIMEDADVYVINPEGLDWLVRHVPRSSPRAPWPWDMIVVDESTKFKHANTMRFKTIKPLLPQFKRRVILTGSPAPNGLLDLFGQVYILDLGHALGRYITNYRLTYFRNPGSGPFDKYVWIPQEGAEEKIYRALRPLVLRMAGEDYLKLPPLIYNRVNVQLPAKAMKAYRQMENELIAALDEGLITAVNAASATTKCRQIANGGIYHEGGEKWTHIHEAKVDAVEEIVEEASGKACLVAYEYRHDLERLLARFGKDTPWIGGGVSAKRFREIEQAWNAGEIPVLLAQPQSVAHGLNLQGVGGGPIIMAGETWDLEVREQFIRRRWRQGQTEPVIVHDIVAEDTVDEVIMKMLNRKDRTQRDLLAALKGSLRRAA